eukprot:2255494-Alexandrium_andersonii.AAC.1
MSRYHVWEDGKDLVPGVGAAPDFGHFKNEVGNKYRSTIFDDGDLDRMAPWKANAFFDAQKRASLSVERRTS